MKLSVSTWHWDSGAAGEGIAGIAGIAVSSKRVK